MACGSITKGSSADCDNLPAGGTRARVIVLNYDDVLNVAVDPVTGKITDIVMENGTHGYAFYGFRADAKMTVEVLKPEIGAPQFKHTTAWVIYERTQLQKNNVEKLARGRFMVIIELKGKDEDSLVLLGESVGVEIVAGVIQDAHANGGFFTVNFATPDDQNEYEGKVPRTIGNTYQAGLALVNALLPASELE